MTKNQRKPAVFRAGTKRIGDVGLKPRERQARIAELVERDGEVTVDALAESFGVSAETIRRDLAHLAEIGEVQKIHGGARRARLHTEDTFDDRMKEAASEKAEIAQKLVQIIKSGDVCFIDTGSTTLSCAHVLSGTPDLTVVTNSARIAHVMARGAGSARVHLIGGLYAPDNGEAVGPDALEQISRFYADYAIIGVAALNVAIGPSAADFDEASIARAMCSNARKIIVVAHGDKFERQAAHRICRLNEIDVLISGNNPAPDSRAALKAAGVTLL